MKLRMSTAGRTGLTSIISAAAAVAALAIPGGVRGQAWLETIDRLPAETLGYVNISSAHPRRVAYYRVSRVVPLGALVRASGTDTQGAWQARADRDRQRIGVPPAISSDKDGDGVDDPFDRWPNDPSRW